MPTKEELTEKYKCLIKKSINNIASGYFTVANRFREKPNVSERVFCYEFYYQLRKLINTSTVDLEKNKIYFHGELSKAKYNNYGKITPDFLIHNPDNGDLNLIAIEIKSVLTDFIKDGNPSGIYKDFLSLCSLLNNNYQLGIFILFNQSYNSFLEYWQNNIDRISDKHSKLFIKYATSIKLLIKESADTEILEKPFQEFLAEINNPNQNPNLMLNYQEEENTL